MIQPIFTSTQKLFLETYFDLCLALTIALVDLLSEFSILWTFPNGNPDIIDSLLFLGTFFAIFGFVIYGYTRI